MFHHNFKALFFCVFIAPFSALADFTINSESSREQIVNSAHAKKFFDIGQTLSRIAIGGSYDSDQNSTQYQGTLRYFYQSNKFIHDLNYLQETEFTDNGSGKKKRYKAKTSELYDLSFSSKIRFFESNNYVAFYHRNVTDKFSTYYHDYNTTLGLGRMFFNDKMELDFSAGYHDSKGFGYAIEFVPSIRLNFRLTNKLTLTQRGYWFVDKKSSDNELKTSLVYRFSPKTSFELRHTFEKRRYEDEKAHRVENQVRKLITVGLVFDLN